MNVKRWWLLAAALIAAGVAASRRAAQDSVSAVDAANPGPAHQRLMKRAGEYTTSTKVAAPGQAGSESTGTAKITSALGGRFLLEENSGSMFGNPTSGLRLLGYNVAAKQYEGAWTYSGSTAVMTLVGTSKDDGKTIECSASYDAAPGAKQSFRAIYRELDDDRFSVELRSIGPDGKDGASFVTTYSRKRP